MSIALTDPKILAAIGTTGLLALAALFVFAQAPNPAAPPELSLDAALSMPPPTAPQGEAAPPDEASAQPKGVRNQPGGQGGTAGRTAQTPQDAEEPARRSPAPAGASGARARSAPMVESQPQGEKGYRIRFASVGAVRGLQSDAHLRLVVETPTGGRYWAPIEPNDAGASSSRLRTIDDREWKQLLGRDRVQRLVNDGDLRSALGYELDGYTFFAVLEAPMIEAIQDAAQLADADVHQSVLLIERGPKVNVALARR
jgi:hypothetical protein